MKIMTRCALRLLVGLAISVSGHALSGPADAQAEETVIIYGGMGHLSNKAQPIFGAIFEGQAQDAPMLRQKMEQKLREKVTGTPFSWSDHPVIFDHQAANHIMDARFADQGQSWNKTITRMDDLIDQFDRVYTLAVVADLELNLTNPPHVDGADYANLVAASVTAVLVDMDTKEIALSASDTRHQPLFSPDGFLPEAQVTHLLTALYMNAAARSIDKLAQKMASRGPSDEFDRYMITGTIFPGKTSQSLFDLGPWRAAEVSSVCALPLQCETTGMCAKLIGLLSAVVTSAYSDAEKFVLPPIGWTYWSDRSTNLIALNLAQPRGGLLEDTLNIKLPAEEAEVKSLIEVHIAKPNINKATQQDSSQRVWAGTRSDTTAIKLHRYETDPHDCSKSPMPANEVLRVHGTHESAISAGYTDPGKDIRQFYTFSTILDAKEKLEREIRKHVP